LENRSRKIAHYTFGKEPTGYLEAYINFSSVK